jgi:hypothetical protein
VNESLQINYKDLSHEKINPNKSITLSTLNNHNIFIFFLFKRNAIMILKSLAGLFEGGLASGFWLRY